MAEGLNKAIELKGIARNTAPSACLDGELEEIINLRYKDGSWKPCGELESVGAIGNYTQLYIHTNSYHHLLGVNNGVLYWFANIEDGSVKSLESAIEICGVVGDVTIKQTGHLLSINNDEGLIYSLFNSQQSKYVTINNDFNGKQTDTSLIPEGLIDFRVTAIVDDGGKPLYSQLKEDIILDKGDGSDMDMQKNGLVIAETLLNKGYSLAKENNFFSKGYFLLCTAIELYDGNYILQSRPILMAPPYITKGAYDKYNPFLTTTPTANHAICDAVYVSGQIPSLENCVFDEAVVGGQVVGKIDLNFDDLYHTYSDYIRPSNKTNFDVKGFELSRYVSVETERQIASEVEGGTPVVVTTLSAINVKPYYPNYIFCYENNSSLYMAHNKLQIRFNSRIAESYKDIIKSVSVFVTPEIDKIDLMSWEKVGIGVNYSPEKFQIYPPHRECEDVLNDIKKLTSFYKIKSYDVEEIKPTQEWLDVELDKGLLSVLTEQERLSIDSSFSRVGNAPNLTFSYNGRLHIADINETKFHGFPLNYFEGQIADGQFPIEDNTEIIHLLKDAFIKIVYETSEGEIDLYRQIELSSLRFLNPILSYPDTRAKSMTIVANTTTNKHYIKTFNLTPHPYFNFAYYIDAELKPISVYSFDLVNGTLEYSKKEYSEKRTNIIKVSSVDNPLYFPTTNTYQIGNSEIIGFATNTIALSTGQAGDAPLYVFTNDGIYALFVDASGQLTYTNSRPIARDICNNPKSITSIDEGVLFTTDRGLMLLSGSEVIDMSDIIEGVPFDITDVPEIHACLNHLQLVKLADRVSNNNFLTYLKGAIIGYNYFDKEIWITNKNYKYSYVYNIKVKGWSKRTQVAQELISDYPYLYLLDEENELKNISGEKVSLAETMFLTRPIKLQTQEFKQGYRTILRSMLDNTPSKTINPSDYSGMDDVVDIVYGDYIKYIDGNTEYILLYTGEDYPTISDLDHEKDQYMNKNCYCGLYLFGSYDCRKWALIGARERDGEIRDLGLLSHRVDCKYFRLLFVGRLKEGSTIEYVEMSAEARLLADKIR